ncbi:hypothetical protein OC842_007072 [Tilletia horrida]|uniref:Essential protein Yae1 N-terminal domain-containing protein n=1 Tax=Tilletia horrida TaxID=155126 RepID=A0AAN6G7D9_9BASI|nr:hypothetical protein OC842_007072 [Tilletia horrida]
MSSYGGHSDADDCSAEDAYSGGGHDDYDYEEEEVAYHEIGEDDRYDEGYQDGYEDGYDCGYEHGYDQGYDDGYRDGQDRDTDAGRGGHDETEDADPQGVILSEHPASDDSHTSSD